MLLWPDCSLVAFDWFRSLPPGSINSWIDLETQFLSYFYEDDTEVTMDKLLSIMQRKEESILDYIERFKNLSLMCPTGMPLPMLLQTCRHNFLDQVEIRMGAIKAHTWKELVEQAEIAEKSAKKFEPSTPKSKWVWTAKTRRDGTVFPSQREGDYVRWAVRGCSSKDQEERRRQ